MARNNVHMAIGLPGKNGVISGMRNSCDTVIEINLLKAVKSGQMPFYSSTNNVVLTPGAGEKGLVPPEFFRSIFDP
jgi:RNA:NAD 2'-phosphotransferase (TPT1/KptA family)